MNQSTIAGIGAAFAALVMTSSPTFARAADATAIAARPAAPVAATATPQPSFIPADFAVPTMVETATFKVVPLGPDLAKIDFDAYMSSIDHLQKTFSRSTSWPREGISDTEAMQDMVSEQTRFAARKSFAYSVLTPDGKRERGCIYVSPSPMPGYDAVVRLWVTKAEYDAGFDAELYRWAARWVQTEWPFRKVAYPGRAIDWSIWDAGVAANKAKPNARRQPSS